MRFFMSLFRREPKVDAGYLGMELPAAWRFTASDSPWRAPVAGPVDAHSDAQIARLKTVLTDHVGVAPVLKVAVGQYTAPIHAIDAAVAPMRSVSCPALPAVLGFSGALPIPSQVWADPSADGHIVLYYPAWGMAWEFWAWASDGLGGYTAGMGGRWSVAGDGYNPIGTGWEKNGAVAAKTPIIAGLVRYEEAVAGEIQHALLMVIPAPCTHAQYRSPVASSTDGTYNLDDCIKQGQRLRLKAGYSFAHLNGATQKLCRCLRDYGAYVMDRGAGWHIKTQNYGDARWGAFQVQLDQVPIEAFEVME